MTVELRERLRRVLGPARSAGPTRFCPDRAGPDVGDVVDGVVVEYAGGACFLAERSFPLDYVHGGERFARFPALLDRIAPYLARNSACAVSDRGSLLFLDTETTGLSGGTGTFVFLVGVAFFEPDRLVARQYFMRHHAEEPAMLVALSRDLDRFRAVVSFNGKAFDIPLLATRYVANRLPPRFSEIEHLDLLFPTRRLWRDRLDSCSLASIERSILRHRRVDDVPSWAIPELYFRYLRDGDARPIARVFRHNLDDILSLVSLASRLGALVADPAEAGADPAELLALARLAEALGRFDDACSRYEAALASASRLREQVEAALGLAALYKRTGRADRAARIWSGLLRAGCRAPLAHVELAKYYEHRRRDYETALAIVDRLLAACELRESTGGERLGSLRAELERRRARLIRKRGRATSMASNLDVAAPLSSG